ncbi:unnamed protein product [Merluccius merluccius]
MEVNSARPAATLRSALEAHAVPRDAAETAGFTSPNTLKSFKMDTVKPLGTGETGTGNADVDGSGSSEGFLRSGAEAQGRWLLEERKWLR